MEKIKKSLFSRVSAIVLALALVLGTIPASIISAQAAGDVNGIVEVIEEVGGTVDNTDTAYVIVKYEGEGVSIKHVESDDTVGRTSSGWYVGAIMNVPEGMTDFTNSAYKNAEGTEVSLADATDVGSIYMWKQIDEAAFTDAKMAGTDLQYTWEFDWDTTTEGIQKVVLTIDTDTVTLSDEDTVKPVVETIAANPSEWTNGAVVVSGTVCDNFSGAKSVSYKQEGTEEVKEAILTGNSFSFTVDATVYEGKYIVWCTDNKDNVSENKEVSVYMDNVAPMVTAQVDVTEWAKESVTISGTVADADSSVKEIYYQKTGETKVKLETFDMVSGTYSITIPAQEYDDIYTIYCVDNANNEASTTVEVKMDNKAPEVTDVKADVTDWTNGSVVISGTVSDAISGVASITWVKDDNKTGTATYDVNTNTFSFEIAAQSYEGNYVITCTDNAGNTTAGNAVSVKMDNDSCVVATGAADKVDWTNSSVVISGTVSDELSGVESVTWTKEDDQTTGQATFDVDKNEYTFEVGAQDYEGNYVITCTDRAGNVSAEFSVSVKMDVTKPVVESAKADVTDWTNGSVVISGEVSDNLSGVASVTWKRADGKTSGNATYNVEDNTYTFTLDAQEYAGEYIITCTDKAGNISEEAKVAVQMDNVAPTLTAEADVTEWTNGSVVISGEVSDALSGVVSVSYGKPGAEATVITLAEGATTYSFTLKADDYNGNYEIYCTDVAGNTSDVQTVEVKMDKTVPVVENAEADVTEWTNGSVVISGKVSDLLSGVTSVAWVKEDDNTTGTATLDDENNTFTINLEAQDYEGKYIITCTDAAGNVSKEVTVEVKMDKTAPTVTKAEANVTTWTNGQVVISGTVGDNLSGVVSVSYKKTGVEEEQSAVFDATKNEYTIVLAADDYEGTYTIYCTDNAKNNSSEATVTVQMDKTAPTLSNVKADIEDWTNGNVVITGNYEDNLSGVQKITVVKKEDNTTVPATMNADGKTFSVVINAQNYEGDYIITCTDAADNTSLAATVSVKMDNEQCVVVTGVAKSADWTNEKVVISGTVDDNLSGVKTVSWVKEGDVTQKGAATFDAEKKEYTFEVAAQDYKGNYIITCTDKAGNVSAQFPVEVKMDIINPVVDEVKADITDWTSTKVVISGEVSDNLAGVEKVTWVKEDDATQTGTAEFDAEKNIFTFDVPAQNYEGNYVITCTDKAGNVSAEEKVPVKMDITNPVVDKAEADITEWTSTKVVISGEVSDNLAKVEKVTWVKEDDATQTGTAEFDAEKNIFTFDVPAQNYEGNYVITCTDKAGNVSAEEKVPVKMDITNPVVDKAEADITEWTSTKVVISGEVSDNLAGVETVTCIKESDKSELSVTYNAEDGIFTVEIPAQSYEGKYVVTCIDKAGNVSTEFPVAVKMDNILPNNLKLTCGEKIWETIIAKVTFGLFYNNTQTMVVDAKDDLSGIKTIEYAEKTVALDEEITREKLENILVWTNLYSAEGEHEVELTGKTREVAKEPNRNIIYCVKVTDYADNVNYVTSDGLIFDTTKPAGGLADDAMVLPSELPMNGEGVVYVPNDTEDVKRPLYSNTAVGEDGVVTFDVNITEETIDGVLQSGIKSVTYEITAKDRADDEVYVATETGTLYTWSEDEALKREFTTQIIVDSAKFNYNYVDLTVAAVDNAGNETIETYEFAIDITAPTVAISYNKNKPVDEANDLGYFNCQRIATITYTERSENWNSGDVVELRDDDGNVVKQLVTALDINGKEVDDADAYIIEWNDIEGTTSDEDTHIATVWFNPTNILEIEEEIEDAANTEDTTESDETTDSTESAETTKPVTGADARYTLDLSYTDAAGNSIVTNEENGELDVTVAEGTVYPFNFVIDTVSPEVVSIEYNETLPEAIINNLTFNYFGANAEVTVTLKDETAGINEFDYEGLLDSNISAKNKAVILTAVENADIMQQEDKSQFVVQFTIPKEALTELNSFRGTVRVNAWDYSDNTVQKHDETRLVVDKIAPTCQVTFDKHVNEVEGVSYYDKAFTATIAIDEANFYAEDVVINVNGSRVTPTDWALTEGTDIWTSHVSFTEEGDYTLTVDYTDRSGNVMASYESNQKTLDTTEPVINVTNIKHESANNEETIGFVLTITDKNMALENVKPQATAVIREGDNSSNYTYKTINIDLGTAADDTNANGETVYTYTVTNLEIDGYYSLVCTVVDHANHTVSNIGSQSEDNREVAVETVNFSVNREGSVFWIETIHNDKYSDTTFNNELNGAYANDEVTVELHEVNVDRVNELTDDDKKTVLTLNDGNDSNTIELVENSDGNGNYERNARIGEGGWYETIYTLGNDQFVKDGTYSLNIITYDKAKNSNVNTNMKNEEGTIQFVVDRTNPVITTNVKSKQIIDANEYTVELTIAEVNLDESTLVVKLEGKEVEWTKVSNNTYQFTLDEAQWANFPRLSQDFEITVKDLAGNSAEVYQREDITVTDDVIIQVAAYMINRPVLLGVTGAGIVAIAGFIIFLIVWKKRRKDEEEA